ncbi:MULTISPECIES: DUF2953 domain-containing protein [Clostridia]|uniref:DUF2953 domain-containing protein n=2 Tax=Bacillota TaxID=1239 RepID=UPI000E4F469B|nr:MULTISPECIES: DUF2953 domain-containing protein [Clostridia]MBN2956205.1 DUF2953 domain-containing protein [Blautia massiliensis (ex Durand et al. 2017)]RHR08744.1 DUF2953 domain-containing protein [Ruminococcus sp. AF20-12LB]
MLHILWLIIKWILILLGILIGLIFLILLLLLFCPIRYRGKLKKDRTDSLREIHATGEVSWLLHIISVQAFWEQGVLKTKICFLGIPLEKFRKKKKPRSLSNSEDQNAKKQTEASRSHEKTSKSEQQNDAAELQMSEPQEDTVEDINEISENVIMEPISISEEISEDEKKLRTKIADLILNIVGKIKTAVGKLIRIIHNFLGIPKRILKKIQSLALTIRNFCDKINWWKEFLDHPRTRAALSFLWKNAKKLIYHVLPTRITGKITFGNEDPAVTGMVLAVLGMTIPFHKNKIEVAPLFDDENVLEGEILLKGRIYGIVVLKTAAELYFNKNIKYVIHRWRHKEVKHGERE